MSARSALRTATADDHQRVDAIYGRFPLGETEGYRAFLRATASAFLPAEAALDEAGAGEFVPDWTVRRRADLLRLDLDDLNAIAPAGAAAFRLSGEAAVLGGIYVLEGSRLGGAMLKRGLPPGVPRRFLDAPSPPGAWRDFSLVLDDRLRDSHDLAHAIMAAKQSFDLFAQAGLAVLEPTT